MAGGTPFGRAFRTGEAAFASGERAPEGGRSCSPNDASIVTIDEFRCVERQCGSLGLARAPDGAKACRRHRFRSISLCKSKKPRGESPFWHLSDGWTEAVLGVAFRTAGRTAEMAPGYRRLEEIVRIWRGGGKRPRGDRRPPVPHHHRGAAHRLRHTPSSSSRQFRRSWSNSTIPHPSPQEKLHQVALLHTAIRPQPPCRNAQPQLLHRER